MAALELAIGVAIVLAVLFDVFQTVVLPRPTPAVFRPSAAIIGSLWDLTYHVAIGMRNAGRRELVLGTFAPFIVALLLVTWVVLLVAGYGLMLFALRHQVQPSPTGLGTALYFSGVALFTLGYGDFVAVGAAARVIVLVEAGTGIGIVALVITFLFTLFGAYQRRETLVISLSARAGAPPSGLVLLETYAKLAMVPELALVFAAWETWSAEVLDAAALVLTTVEDVPRGPAYLLQSIGTHLVGDLGQHFHLNGSHDPYVEEAEFTTARDRLLAAGYHLKDAPSSWLAFSHLRSEYAGILNDMAKRWATPPALWIGDRSRLRPHGRGHK